MGQKSTLILPNSFDLFVQIQEKVLIWVLHKKLSITYQLTQFWVDTSSGTCKMTLDRWNLIANSRMNLVDGNASALKLGRTKMKAIDSNFSDTLQSFKWVIVQSIHGFYSKYCCYPNDAQNKLRFNIFICCSCLMKKGSYLQCKNGIIFRRKPF